MLETHYLLHPSSQRLSGGLCAVVLSRSLRVAHLRAALPVSVYIGSHLWGI
jgi:hypothetical protein